MAAAMIPAPKSVKRSTRHKYVYQRGAQGDLECYAGSKYQAWILMRAHGYNVDIERIIDCGPDKIHPIKPLE